MDVFEVYESSWISLWAIDPGSTSAPNMTVFHAKWAPWVPRLRKFMGGQTDDIIEASGLPRSSCAASDATARMHLDRFEVCGSSWISIGGQSIVAARTRST
jgi:hypothetical protein